MTEETRLPHPDSLEQSADARSYEPPVLTTLGTVGELTSANEDSGSVDSNF